MKNSIKTAVVLVIIAFMTFSFTTAEGDKKEIKSENKYNTAKKENKKIQY